MRRGTVAWLLLSAIGAAIVAVPDDGPRVVVLSDGHGPSAWDLAGVLILLAGWICMLIPLLRARSDLPLAPVFLLAVIAGLAVVTWSVSQDAGAWWVLGAGVAAGAQLVAAGVVALRPLPLR